MRRVQQLVIVLASAGALRAQCGPQLNVSACPSVVHRTLLVQDPSAAGNPPAGPTAINGVGRGSAVSTSFVSGMRTFWKISECNAAFQVYSPVPMGAAAVTPSVLRDPSASYEHVFVRGPQLLASSVFGGMIIPLQGTNLPNTPWDLTSDKSGSPRYAFANHVTGRVSVCMRRCDTSGVLHDFNFADQNGNAIRIRLIRFHYPHLVVVGQNPAGVAHVFYQNVVTNAREVLSSWGSPESTADVNGELVVFSRIPLAIPPAARYVFWYWRIGSPVATAQQVFPNACANFDFRHPRLTNTHLIFLLRWLNTLDKVEMEAYPLASLGTGNQTACILSGDLIPWNRVHPWHEVWQAGRGAGAVSFYTLQTRGAPPSLQVTCWE